MIDTHCHIDLFSDPLGTARTLERELSLCVAVTMLPSHFTLAQQHLAPFERVIASLGLHPLRIREARTEIELFTRLAKTSRFFGEIGLDGSPEGKATLALQKELFTEAICAIPAGAFVTVHSRGAWRETLELLRTHHIGPVCFHYFTGGMEGAKAVLAEGHFLSINHRMIRSSYRHRSLAESLPRERVLVETDGPFLGKQPLTQLKAVYQFLTETWQTDAVEVVRRNFALCCTTPIPEGFKKI